MAAEMGQCTQIPDLLATGKTYYAFYARILLQIIAAPHHHIPAQGLDLSYCLVGLACDIFVLFQMLSSLLCGLRSCGHQARQPGIKFFVTKPRRPPQAAAEDLAGLISGINWTLNPPIGHLKYIEGKAVAEQR
jgi:hypothetical protein